MRLKLTGTALVVATTLFAGTAIAAEGRGGGKGGAGPGGGGGGGGGAGGGSGDGPSSEAMIDRPGGYRPGGVPGGKRWEVEGTYEYHRLVRQGDLGGSGANRNFNYLSFGAHYDLTKFDRFGFLGGFYQRVIADEGETGLRLDDIFLSYTRFIPLPEKFMVRALIGTFLPTSFASQKAGYIAIPRASVRLERFVTADPEYGRFYFALRTVAQYFMAKYSTAEGGSANHKYRAGVGIDAEYKIPKVPPALWFGIALSTNYYWFYNVHDAPNPNSERFGSVIDPNFDKSPMSQTYGGQVYLRYSLPSWEDIRADFTLSYGQGDPTLGYTSVLHDGVAHGYLFWRRNSEVFATLTVRY